MVKRVCVLPCSRGGSLGKGAAFPSGTHGKTRARFTMLHGEDVGSLQRSFGGSLEFLGVLWGSRGVKETGTHGKTCLESVLERRGALPKGHMVKGVRVLPCYMEGITKLGASETELNGSRVK